MNESPTASEEDLDASRAEVDRWRAEFEKINHERFMLLKEIDQMSRIHAGTMQKICTLLVQAYDKEDRNERQELYEIIKNKYMPHIAGWKSQCDSSRQHVEKLRELLRLILIEDYQI